jgi:phage terminase large subunit-like protein
MQNLIDTSGSLPPPSPDTTSLRLELARALRSKNGRQRTNKLKDYRPYPKQQDFHAAGAQFGERLFMAGNQLGKTWAGAFEVAMHLTGRYPDWWTGATFENAPKWWVAGVTGESTRDNPQRVLVGPPQIQAERGTGAIPKECLIDATSSRGTPDALDSLVVRHGGGADVQASHAIVLFKAYEKGREKWQGDTIDGVWFDEEPPMEIYSEGRTRTNKGQRSVFNIITFTPLLGMSDVVRLFLSDDQVERMK